MTSPTDLAQLYILLSYEKLQRSTISQRQRPTEASLRNRLLVWRFLKKIENEPVSPIINSEEQISTNNDHNNSPWILDLNENCHDNEIDMDIDSDIITVVNTNEPNNNSTCDTMDIEQDTAADVALLLKRAIGAERRQKSTSTETLILNENNNNNNNNNLLISETTTLEETEQFFHDLCAELTNTTAAIVSSSSTNTLRCPTPSEQTLIH